MGFYQRGGVSKGRMLQTILILLAVSQHVRSQDCVDKNCAFCPSKSICQNCFSGYYLEDATKVCTAIVYCAVKNCDVCPSSSSSVCTRCVQGYELDSSNTLCSDKEKEAMNMFLIGGLIAFVGFLLICCCVAHRRKMLAQRNYRDSDINSVITQDDHGVGATAVVSSHPVIPRPMNQLTPNKLQPPLPPSPAQPHPSFHSYSTSPAPPPGNSLLFAHRGH